MEKENEKKLKELLRAEFLPLFVGLRNELKSLGEKLEVIKQKEPPQVQKVLVENQLEIPKEVEVKNFPQLSKVEITNPQKEVEVRGIGLFFDKLFDGFSAVSEGLKALSLAFGKEIKEMASKIFKVEVINQKEFPSEIKATILNPQDFKQEPPIIPNRIFIENSEPKDAVPVVLTTHDKKKFYESIQQIIAGNDISLDKVIKAIENISVSINPGDIQIGAVEIKDGDSDTRLDVESDPVATTKNSALIQAPSLLAELVAIKGYVDGLEGFTDGIETKLQTIIDLLTTPSAAQVSNLWQTETFNGKGFTTLTQEITISNTLENDFFLLKNPVSSGKIVRFQNLLMYLEKGTSVVFGTFRIYRQPTITADGTALTINKIRPSQTASSVCSAFKLPTISSRGTLVTSLRSNTEQFNQRFQDLGRYLEENNNLLVTFQPETSGTTATVLFEWLEVTP